MGQRGPAKRPTQLALLHGEKKSRLNLDEPVPAEGYPVPPYELSAEAQEVWDFTVEQLRVMRTLTPADRDLLVAFVESVVMHRAVTRELAVPEHSRPIVLNSKGDAYVRNPLVAMQRDSATLVRILAREFGLSPSARTAIVMGSGDKPQGTGPERLLT